MFAAGAFPVMVAAAGVIPPVIVMLNDLLLVIPSESVTVTVNVVGSPAVVGVFWMSPVASMVRPAGRDPEVMLHVSGSVPPVAANCCEYGELTTPPGNGLAVVMDGAAFTRIVADVLVTVFGPESVTLTVNVNVPGEPLTVPLISPLVEFSDKPVGSAPLAIVYEP